MAKTYKGVIQHYKSVPEKVQKYFPDFIELVTGYDWEVSISYVSSRIEQAKRMTIYCGIVKLHECHSKLTWELVSKDHISRKRFKELFKIIFGRNIESNLLAKLEKGEAIRDKIAHGMKWTPKEAREGLTSILDFAIEFNDFVYKRARFRPFGDLRGFKGRNSALKKDTTRWVLRGMGIPHKNESENENEQKAQQQNSQHS